MFVNPFPVLSHRHHRDADMPREVKFYSLPEGIGAWQRLNIEYLADRLGLIDIYAAEVDGRPVNKSKFPITFPKARTCAAPARIGEPNTQVVHLRDPVERVEIRNILQ
jgi:hypothetical protein